MFILARDGCGRIVRLMVLIPAYRWRVVRGILGTSGDQQLRRVALAPVASESDPAGNILRKSGLDCSPAYGAVEKALAVAGEPRTPGSPPQWASKAHPLCWSAITWCSGDGLAALKARTEAARSDGIN
jgi:hypothetical protein